MTTARLFSNGRSQAVRLPKDCRFEGTEVFVKRHGGMVLLIPKAAPWASLLESLEHFTPDFMTRRRQPVQSRRRGL